MTTHVAFRKLDLRIRRLLDGRMSGDHSSALLGPGTEPEELARYRPGEDDVRRIDWNVTARSGEPHVWRPRAERELTTWVLLDVSPSMHFGTVVGEKVDLAIAVTAAIGLVTSGPGNRTGAIAIGADGLRELRPAPGRRLARRALGMPPAPRSGNETPAMAAVIERLHRRHPRPGLRVIVSDFLPQDGHQQRPFEWEAPLRRLARRHDVLVVEILDPRDLELPDVGPVVLEDPESGEEWEVWTSDGRLRERYAAAATAGREEVAAAIRAAGCTHVILRTDRDWIHDLAREVRRHHVRRRPVGRPGRGPR